ncbi:sialic acid TRAP transporter substrate-binding protein SiaP [Ornithinibacillus halophilus]|uniref:Tripartite ATP-independent transporter solute receptor, DctP family n=1 Tax=Ornithinibacillus halophilus TaxID=930117 RepID=A0A1M5HLS9_9BACI|nr:sialic acid TRAP transporter substrate-binding protein SiaP [Ornithinibacillus halophilus]SHG16914.1 tripartite ATP-independent transporter solute receptor, DctP family [Ornithinibacillus halophilus]
MKKKLLLMITLSIVLILAACGDSDDNNSSGNNGENSGDPIELQFGMQPNTQSNEYEAAQFLADYVEEESDGQLTITIFPDAQLGNDLSMLGQLTDGSLDITLSEMGRFGEWLPRAELLAVPYVIENFDHIKRVVYETEFGEELRNELIEEHGLRVVDSAYNGTRVTSSSSPINELADMEGMSLRVPEAQTLLDYAEYTGAVPTPMAFGEVYLALQTGQVDGQENPLPTIRAQSFHEVQDYIALTNHVVNDNTYVVSEKTWQDLPEDLRSILEEGIDKATDHHTELFETEEAELIEFFEGEGVTVTEPDVSEFRDALSEAYPNYYESIGDGAEEYMELIQEARQ